MLSVTEEDLDFSAMSAHQTKTLEMEAQVHLLKLESEVVVCFVCVGVCVCVCVCSCVCVCLCVCVCQGWHKKPSAKNPPRVFFKKTHPKNQKIRWVLLGFLGFLDKS